MINTSVEYMGLKLKNPVIAGSSGLTNSFENILKIEKAGAGAVVLKSLFEEQILQEINITHSELTFSYPEANDYIKNYSQQNEVGNYIELIKKCKSTISIPVIASINCVSSNEWTGFAKKIQEAGADALELNIFVLPSDPDKTAEDNEKEYFDIIEKVRKEISIPIAIKISSYFSGLANFAKKLAWTDINAMVLFNRFYSPDIDIQKMEVIPTHVFSTPEEISLPLRWVAMISDIVECDIAASTGIHDSAGVIKQLLAGANAVQICSVLYKKSINEISLIIKGLENWMEKNNHSSIDDFRGKLSAKGNKNPAAYERVQFMKHFASIE